MKKLSFIKSVLLPMVTIVTLLICNNAKAQIKLKTDGKIGFGTTNPATDLDVYRNEVLFHSSTSTASILVKYYYGTEPLIEPTLNNRGYLGNQNRWLVVRSKYIYCNDVPVYSDAKIKENVRDLDNSLDKVLLLRGVMYNLIDPETEDTVANTTEKTQNAEPEDQIGLIANEVLEVVPEVVKFDTIMNLYTISYTQLIPLLIEAIKTQDERLVELESKVKDKEEKSAETPNQSGVLTATLGKNRPNPFNENTTISYYLPSNVQTAMLYIYDLQGKQMKSIRITGREQGQVTIQGSELRPGIYNYSLIADGEVIGIEKMILTD